MRVALLTQVFPGPFDRLATALAEAVRDGARLAVLPELALNEWEPIGTRTPRDEDSEPDEGPRYRALSAAAREVGIALVGGAILRDHEGRRHNTALVFDRGGELVARYRKLHLPDEESFFEVSHYQPGGEAPRPVHVEDVDLGIQLCSDIQRPSGAQLLAAAGVHLLVVPRATPPASYERWKIVMRAAALTSAAFLISVNRPEEPGSPCGGPSVVIDPNGDVTLETTGPLAVMDIDPKVAERARREYPGYLSHRGEVYAEGWRRE